MQLVLHEMMQHILQNVRAASSGPGRFSIKLFRITLTRKNKMQDFLRLERFCVHFCVIVFILKKESFHDDFHTILNHSSCL